MLISIHPDNPQARQLSQVKACLESGGIIPDNNIALSIIKTLGHPILSTSFPGDTIEDYTDPEIIYEHWGNQIDMVVDGGIGGMVPSTVVDCTGETYEVIRQGLGVWDY